ncbi:hypothetical protein ACIGBH_40390 [Streptomyces sp. NPDC085929]|uniref:hypothetical protein n=1 Tax=Streptomyces sp. NPDC085929 TaxID=3365739 RepID=UPI0037CE9A24
MPAAESHAAGPAASPAPPDQTPATSGAGSDSSAATPFNTWGAFRELLKQKRIEIGIGVAAAFGPLIENQFEPPFKGYALVVELVLLAAALIYVLRCSPHTFRRLCHHLRHIGSGGWIAIRHAAALRLLPGLHRRAVITGKLFIVFALVWSYLSGQIASALVPDWSRYYTYSGISSNLFSRTPCDVTGTRATLTVDGQGLSLPVDLDITTSAGQGEHYWIVSQALGASQQVYFAKHELTPQEASSGHHNGIMIHLSSNVSDGNVRYISLVCATNQGEAGLQGYRDDNGAPTELLDVRKSLPDGVVKISKDVRNVTHL